MQKKKRGGRSPEKSKQKQWQHMSLLAQEADPPGQLGSPKSREDWARPVSPSSVNATLGTTAVWFPRVHPKTLSNMLLLESYVEIPGKVSLKTR